MPGFPFTTIEPNQLGRVTKFDIPVNEWMGIKFSSAQNDTLGEAITRRTEDAIYDDDVKMRPDVANKAFGIEGALQFDEPVSVQRARLMHERKRKEIEQLSYLESASHSWFSAKALAGFGASLVGSLSHPVDLGLTFLPFVGSEKAAAGVAKLGGGAFRQALARGVIAEEAFAGRVFAPKLTAAVVDGIVNQTAMEIPIAVQKYRDQAFYGPADSALNILAGGAFAGGVKGLALALEGALRAWNNADVRIKDAAIKDTVDSILQGKEPQSHTGFTVDEAVIREKVLQRMPFDEAAVRIEAEQVVDEVLPLPESRTIDITDVESIERHAEIEQRIQEEREKAINDFIAVRKTEHETRLKDEVDAETKAAIAKVKTDAPPLPREQVDKYAAKTPEKQTAAVQEDLPTLEKEILDSEPDPEKRAALEAELKETLAEIDKASAAKIVDVLLPCVTSKSRG
jgi:hypothetical protein